MATHDSYLLRDCLEDEGASDDWSADEFDESNDEIYDCPEDAKPSQGERPSSGEGSESDEIYDLPDDAKVILDSQSDPDHRSTLPDSDRSPSTSGNIDIANLKRRFETAGSGNNQSINGFSSNSKAAFETYDRPKNWPVAGKPRPSLDPKPKVIPPKPLQPKPDATERGNGPPAATGSNSIRRRWPPSREDQENSNIVSTYDTVPVHNEKQRAIATKLSKFLKGSNTVNLRENMAGNDNSLSQNNRTVEQRSVNGNSNPVAGPPRIDRSTRPNLRKQSTDAPARPENNARPHNAPVKENNQVKFEPRPARQNSLTRQVSSPEDEEEDYIEPIAEAEDQYVVPTEGASRSDDFMNYEVPDEMPVKNGTQQGQSHEPVPEPPRNRQAIRQSYADIIICPPTKSQRGTFNDFGSRETTRRSPPMGQWDGNPPEADIDYEVPDHSQTPKRPSRHGPSTHQSGNNTYPGLNQRDSFKAHPPPRPSKDTRPQGRQQFTQPATSNEEVSGPQSDENYEVVDGGAPPPTQNRGMARVPFNIDRHQNMSGNPVSNRGAVPPLPPPEECQENYEVIGQNNKPVMTEAYEIPSLADQNPASGRRCPPEGQENRRFSNSNKKKVFSEEEKMLNQVLTGLTNPQRNKPPAREPMPKDPPPRSPLQRDRPPKDESPKEPPREPKKDSMSNRRLPPTPVPGATDDGPILDLNELQNSVKPQKPSRPGRPLPADEPNNNTSLEPQPWFHGNLGRQQAESKLRSLSKDGCFVVRNTDKIDGYTISIYYQGEIRHIHIFRKQNKYHLGTSDQKFDSVIQLVNHFKINAIDLKKGGTTKLTVTVPSR